MVDLGSGPWFSLPDRLKGPGEDTDSKTMVRIWWLLIIFLTMLRDDYITFNASCEGSREQNIIHLCICIDIFFFLMNALVFRETFLDMSNPPCCYLQVKLSCSIICIFGFGVSSHGWIDLIPKERERDESNTVTVIDAYSFYVIFAYSFFLDLYFKLVLDFSWNESNEK